MDGCAFSDARSRIVRALSRITSCITSATDYKADRENVGKKAKLSNMFAEVSNLRKCVEEDLLTMEHMVNKGSGPAGVDSNAISNALSDQFFNLYFEVAAFADVHNFSLTPRLDSSMAATQSFNQSVNQTQSASFRLAQRKLPTFSGNRTEWLSFESLFKSIISHATDLPDVEKFEYLLASLKDDALALVIHLPVTSANYLSAWDMLDTRYGNIRDLARDHLDALLAPRSVSIDDASSIQLFVTSIQEHSAALNNLGYIPTQWSPVLIYNFEKSLDSDLRGEWESHVGDRHLLTVKEFVEFLRSRIRTAEARARVHSVVPSRTTHSKSSNQKWNPAKQRTPTSKVMSALTSTPLPKCPLCNQLHSLRKCPIFLTKTPSERYQIAKTEQLCFNCLGQGHGSTTCSSKYKCQICKRSHHSLLHFTSSSSVPPSSLPSSSSVSVVQLVSPQESTSLLVQGQPHKTVLLSTVILDICDKGGNRHSFRALLDSGSQASFITEASADRLILNRRRAHVNISTFANSTAKPIRNSSTVAVMPRGKSSPSICTDTLIVSQITGPTPQRSVTPRSWPHILNLPLADPYYYAPGAVDMLLGADVLPVILCDGRRSGLVGEPTAWETVFGWALFGPTTEPSPVSLTSLCVSISDCLEGTLKKFWELEELPTIRRFSSDEQAAEAIYTSSVKRLSSGRFMISLPFRSPSPLIGDSKSVALQRFKSLEHRLSQNNTLRQQYCDFMRDYLSSGHMELVPENERGIPYNYYIPHHCVLKPDSQTTKLRVVFNASSRTALGISLNDKLYTGPKLQPDIQVVLLRSRLWKYVFMADIKQMYRQIVICPSDRNYLRIVWRFSTTTPIEEYRLCTVTYGTSAAPYQALRTVRELAATDGIKWPIAAHVLLNDTFVDDILTGADSDQDALECQQQLINLCSEAQFELRKWASNNNSILQAVNDDERAMSPSVLLGDEEQPGLKILGLKWNPCADTFSFVVKPSTTTPTKRSVLSDIARVFDPLGFLCPLTFWMKHIMQQLWTSGISWDDPIPSDLAGQWAKFQAEMSVIETLAIPRRLTHDQGVSIQVHVFSDSSEKGYAAAAYFVVNTTTEVYCNLIMGKSKVAPLKRSTIPRLELCGAVLAAKLLRLVINTYQDRIVISEMHAWTDLTTVLGWIRSSPHRWPTFVANRTSQIHDLTPPSIWRHVPTNDNPVDCASRGLGPSELVNHSLWWTGPDFLRSPADKWPQLMVNITDDSVDQPLVMVAVMPINPIIDLLHRCSSLNKIQRIIGYCLRFVKPRKDISFNLTMCADEMTCALLALVYVCQQQTFSQDLLLLTAGKPCSKPLRGLDIFIDKSGLLRVGGRLQHANIPYNHKHPLLLPSRHRLTHLIIDHHHRALQHPGAMALKAQLQRDFWILSARQSIRSRLRLCIPCFRTRPTPIQPKMAELPKYRVQQIKPFAITGVDYAGPVTIKGPRGRAFGKNVAYICLFVCTATKAVHIEVSSSLTTETFLMAFTRFIARRGPVKEMHSDNGTNFVGAANLLNPLNQHISSINFQSRIQNHLSNNQIAWHFNPPSSPHFGGLWEAGVKSTKTLLHRSIGAHILTCEELVTLLTKIEATLNSRPLCPVSNDALDLEALTPSHFLTLEPSNSAPDPRLEQVPLSKLQRWRLITDIHRYFWNRWTNEYLANLQSRSKWVNHGVTVQLGDLVVIKEPTHPLYWQYGRIEQLHPGHDGIARVASVHTTSGTIKRPLVKLCPLPSC